MSPDGTTTLVRVGKSKVDPSDKKILCSAMCHCDKAPNLGKGGIQLKQGCVVERLKSLDHILDHRSPYKHEVNYDMTKSPPAPIMDSNIATKGHDWLPGWLGKHWGQDEAHPPFKAGEGMIRRPDVVIVKDPTKPPTQDNIKQIVEMKFPPDTLSEQQALAYEAIAGDPLKLETLQPADCDCDSADTSKSVLPVEKMGWAAAVAALLMLTGTRGRSPVPALP